MRESLLGYYMDKMKNANSSAAAFAKADMPTHPALILCRLQRHMQALGAYGFLSSVIGKKYFLKHIPEGLRLLKEDVALVKDDYPELYGLVMGL